MRLFCAAAVLATAATASRCPAPAPKEIGQTIHPNGNTDLCLTAGYDKEAGKWTNATVETCNGSPYQVWTGLGRNSYAQYEYGHTTTVMLTGAGPNLALRPIATADRNGAHLYLGMNAKFSWEVFFTYSADGVLEQYGVDGNLKGYCLDLTDGDRAPGTEVQTWECYEGNTNQVWTLGPDVEVRTGSLPERVE